MLTSKATKKSRRAILEIAKFSSTYIFYVSIINKYFNFFHSSVPTHLRHNVVIVTVKKSDRRCKNIPSERERERKKTEYKMWVIAISDVNTRNEKQFFFVCAVSDLPKSLGIGIISTTHSWKNHFQMMKLFRCCLAGCHISLSRASHTIVCYYSCSS